MLTDIDKHRADRSGPVPNLHDVVASTANMAKGTNALNYVTPATNQALVKGAKNGQFTVVQTALLEASTVYSDNSPDSSTFVKGKFTLAQVPHGLNFTPGLEMWSVSIQTYNNYSMMPVMTMSVGNPDGSNNPGANAIWASFRPAVDDTYLYVFVDYMLLNYTLTQTNANVYAFRYYLLQQSSK